MSSRNLQLPRPPDVHVVTAAAAAYLAEYCAQPDRTARRDLQGGGAIGGFEAALARVVGKKFCVTANNCTNGLLTAALATGLVDGEIVTTRRSYGATWGPFLHLGNQLRFADVDARGNISPAAAARLVTPRTTAVLAVDYRGQPHDSTAIRRICDRHGLVYIADAAQSFGRFRRDGAHAATLADVVVLSFGPGKPLWCGEGGAILTDDETIYRSCIKVSQHPERFRAEFSLRDFTEIQALNARIHPLAAVLGLAQLRALELQDPS